MLAQTRQWTEHCRPQHPGSQWSPLRRADTPSLQPTGSRSCCHSVGIRSCERELSLEKLLEPESHPIVRRECWKPFLGATRANLFLPETRHQGEKRRSEWGLCQHPPLVGEKVGSRGSFSCSVLGRKLKGTQIRRPSSNSNSA